MRIELAVVSILFLLSIGIVVYVINKKIASLSARQNDKALLEWLKSMQQSLEQTNKTLHDSLRVSSADMVKTLQHNSRELNDRLDKAAAVIRDVGKEVGHMSEIGRSMRELQEFLKSPKLRGNIGEQVLKDLITQMFPKSTFYLQYQFKSGERVDAAIKTDAGILPIDAKFPMENFQKMIKASGDNEIKIFQKEFIRDIKKHIDAIAKKYILPHEGTMDFALMYVPSETVYYDIVNLLEVIEYAKNKRVYIVSPSTLYIHLQTILLSFEGKRIESKSKEVFKILRAMQIDYGKVQDSLMILGKHVTNASSQFHNVSQGFGALGNKLEQTKLVEEETLKTLEES